MRLTKKIVFVVLLNEDYHNGAHLIIKIPKGDKRNEGKTNITGN
jgi:hypothetical protein